MRTSGHQKTCYNCHSLIPVESPECIYCGADVSQDAGSHEGTPLFTQQSLEESLSSLYKPPHSIHNRPPKSSEEEDSEKLTQPSLFAQEEEKQTPKAPYKPPFEKAPLFQPVVPVQQDALSFEESREETSKEEPAIHQPRSFWAMLSMLIGGNLLTMGALQLLFSEGNTLRLEWDASYWFVYAALSLPLLYLGYRKASKVD